MAQREKRRRRERERAGRRRDDDRRQTNDDDDDRRANEGEPRGPKGKREEGPEKSEVGVRRIRMRKGMVRGKREGVEKYKG